mmetsp:Transcript_16614/g.24976  ORF Transcript_16614/g.24976 Transcript_16614/m.24976 type:complete len:470 (-) Transcript_16614:115-1524(-)
MAEVGEPEDPEISVLEPEEDEKFMGQDGEGDESLTEDDKYEIRWLRYTLIMGIPPALTRRQWNVFALLSLAGFFSVYDDVLRAVCIDDIQKDLGISETDLPFVITIIRCGAIPAFVLTLLADITGRRPLLLLTISMYTICTALSAVSFDIYWFTTTQFLGKLFLMGEYLVSNVAIIEEFDAGTRGWAMGALGSIATAGGGFALCLYAAVAGTSYGWRLLYVIGVLPLVVLTYLRRGLPETRNFAERVKNGPESQIVEARGCERCTLAMHALWVPLVKLWNTDRLRTCLFSAIVFFFGLSSHAAAFYQFKYLEEERGYDSVDIFLLGVFGGIAAIVLYAFMGQLTDTYGRRPFLVGIYVVFYVVCIVFYNISVVWLIPIIWILFAATGFGLEILNMTIISEAFKTESRATAQGVTTVLYTLGTVFGILIEGLIFETNRSHATSITYLSLTGVICPLLSCFIPETYKEHLD